MCNYSRRTCRTTNIRLQCLEWWEWRCQRRGCHCSRSPSTEHRSRRRCKCRGRDGRGSATYRRKCLRYSSSTDRNLHACPAPNHLPLATHEVNTSVRAGDDLSSRDLTIQTPKGNYNATSNNTKLVHWPLVGELLHLVQRGEAWACCGPAQSPPRCTKCNSPPNGQCTNHCIAMMVRCSAVLMWRLMG